MEKIKNFRWALTNKAQKWMGGGWRQCFSKKSVSRGGWNGRNLLNDFIHLIASGDTKRDEMALFCRLFSLLIHHKMCVSVALLRTDLNMKWFVLHFSSSSYSLLKKIPKIPIWNFPIEKKETFLWDVGCVCVDADSKII